MTDKSDRGRATRRFPAISADALREERAAQVARSRRSMQHPAVRVLGGLFDLLALLSLLF